MTYMTGKLDIGLTGRDWKYLDRHSGELLKNNTVYKKICSRYIPTANLIADAVYQGNPPDPWVGRYWISGGDNKRLENGDPSDFMIEDKNGYVEGFSLKDDSPALFGGSTTHLLDFISPEMTECLRNSKKAIEEGKEYLQGRRIFTKDHKRLKQDIGYNWHLGAEEMYQNRAYEMCLQSFLEFFVQERRRISREAGGGDLPLCIL